jgi:hypothetical protein
MIELVSNVVYIIILFISNTILANSIYLLDKSELIFKQRFVCFINASPL